MLDLLRMGQIGRPHGIKGELGALWDGEYLPHAGDEVFLGSGKSNPTAFRITGARNHNGRLLLTFDGVASRTDAESLKGMSIYMSRSQLPEPANDEAYLEDLPGCEIFLADGAPVGRLDHVEYPANRLVWSIRTSDGKEIMFPAIPEFINSFDLENRRIIISPPSGLLEIYRA